MKNSKVNLTTLKVCSFVTALKEDAERKIIGGASDQATPCGMCSHTCDNGPLAMM